MAARKKATAQAQETAPTVEPEVASTPPTQEQESEPVPEPTPANVPEAPTPEPEPEAEQDPTPAPEPDPAPAEETPSFPFKATVCVALAVLRRDIPPATAEMLKPVATLPQGTKVTITTIRDGFARLQNGLWISASHITR